MARRHARSKRTPAQTADTPTPHQLPTPLPDQHSPSPHPPEDIQFLTEPEQGLGPDQGPELSQLIDFDAPPTFGFEPYEQRTDELEIEFDRSPPYREARLLDDDEDEGEFKQGIEEEEDSIPIPIPPRVHQEGEEDEYGSVHGHTRTPTLPRSPVYDGLQRNFDGLQRNFDGFQRNFDGLQRNLDALPSLPRTIDSISRTLRTYVPSSASSGAGAGAGASYGRAGAGYGRAGAGYGRAGRAATSYGQVAPPHTYVPTTTSPSSVFPPSREYAVRSFRSAPPLSGSGSSPREYVPSSVDEYVASSIDGYVPSPSSTHEYVASPSSTSPYNQAPSPLSAHDYAQSPSSTYNRAPPSMHDYVQSPSSPHNYAQSPSSPHNQAPSHSPSSPHNYAHSPSSPHNYAPSPSSPHNTQSPSSPHNHTPSSPHNYAPSSIHIPVPNAGPSPPLVSRPVSFGRFSGRGRGVASASGGIGGERIGSGRGDGKSARVGGGIGSGGGRRERVSDEVYDSPRKEEWYGGGGEEHVYGREGQETRSLLQAQEARPRPQDGLVSHPYPRADAETMDVIQWARWDVLRDSRWDVLHDRNLLILAYPRGVQIWDCTKLASVCEVLNLNLDVDLEVGEGEDGAKGQGRGRGRGQGQGQGRHGQGQGRHGQGQGRHGQGRIVHAGVLPVPKDRGDSFLHDRPLLGILMEFPFYAPTTSSSSKFDEELEFEFDHPSSQRGQASRVYPHAYTSTLTLYSLKTHRYLMRIVVPGRAEMFLANAWVVVVSTSLPPSLLVYSATTFQLLLSVPSAVLAPHTRVHQSSSSSSGISHTLSNYTPSSARTLSISNNTNTNNNNNNSLNAPFMADTNIDTNNHNRNANNNRNSNVNTNVNTNANTTKTNNNNNNNNRVLLGPGSGLSIDPSTDAPPSPAPVFALSQRLLAFASPPPSSSASFVRGGVPAAFSSSSSHPHPHSYSSSHPHSYSGPPSSSSGSGAGTGTGTSPSSAPLSSSPFGGFMAGVGKGKGLAEMTQGIAGVTQGITGMTQGISGITGMTQAELGSAALKVGTKVGGSVLTGMRFLGGMAYDAAKSRVAAAGGVGVAGGVGGGGSGGSSTGKNQNQFFSRSAPTAGAGEGVVEYEDAATRRLRRFSGHTLVPPPPSWDTKLSQDSTVTREQSTGEHSTTVAPLAALTKVDTGHYVTVLDLGALLVGNVDPVPGRERDYDYAEYVQRAKVAEFVASESQVIVDLRFSKDGCRLLTAPKDGRTFKVFQIRPAPRILRGVGEEMAGSVVVGGGGGNVVAAASSGLSVARSRHDSVLHMYNLWRGVTNGVVEGIDWAGDGRWVALATRNRTVHVFPVNPYGRKPDVKSHMDGRVRNDDSVQRSCVQVKAIAKLRTSKSSSQIHHPAPLALAFVHSSEASLPSNLLPPATSPPPADPTESPPLSPHAPKRPKNFQDILIFDPTDGKLHLRRMTIQQHPKEQGISVSSVPGLGSTGLSLPKMSAAGRLSVSPSTSSTSRSPGSLTQAVEQEMELGADDRVVATWHLQRRRDWGEIKQSLVQKVEAPQILSRTASNDDWLAHAELSTCSSSSRVLSRSIYAAHQFSFYTLGEDYHALIRRHQFNICGAKIEVRKPIEISAFPRGVGGAGGNEAFVEGFPSSPRDMRRAGTTSSFDEPLASAIAGDFDHTHPSSVLPMYPNGGTSSGSIPKSLLSSIPIRTMAGLGDGMTESLGRIRREIHKVRSPPLVRSDGSAVPLEFNEEDEDFISREALDVPVPVSKSSRGTSRGDAASADSELLISTPSSGAGHSFERAVGVVADSGSGGGDEVDDVWQGGWEAEDKLAVEEAEQFDEIAVTGLMDEEQAPIQAVADKRKGRAKRRRG